MVKENAPSQTEGFPQDLDQIRQIFKQEWVLAEVLELDAEGTPKRVRVLKHSKNRDEIYQALSSVESGKHVCILYTGEIPQKDYAVAYGLP